MSTTEAKVSVRIHLFLFFFQYQLQYHTDRDPASNLLTLKRSPIFLSMKICRVLIIIRALPPMNRMI